MSSELRNRPSRRSRVARVLQSLVFIIPLTVPVLVVLASPQATALKDAWSVIIGPAGPANAATAFGSFNQGPTVTIYQPVEVTGVPPGSELTIESGSIRVTSPGGIPSMGAVTWSVIATGGNGEPDPSTEYGSGDIDIPDDLPTYPETTTAALNLGPEGVTLPPGVTSFHLCAETKNAAVHFPGFPVPGNTLTVEESGQPTREIQDIAAGTTLSGDSGIVTTPTPPITPTTVPTPGPVVIDQRYPQGGAGPGSNQSAFNTNVVKYLPTGSGPYLVTDEEYPRNGNQWVLVTKTTMPPGMMNEILVGDFRQGFGQYRVLSTPSRKSSHDAVPMTQAVIFATLADGREFGQFFQAMTPAAAQQAGETSLLFTTHDPVRYRVNVGVAAVADGTRVRLTPLRDGGVVLAAPQIVELDDGGSTQFNDIDSAWGLGNTPNVMVRVEVLAGAAFPYASVLDGRGAVPGTSDPTTVLPVTAGARRVVLLEMGRITGLDQFSGSAMLYNHNAAAASVDVAFYERGVPGVSDTATVDVDGESVVSWDDAVGDLIGRTGVVGSLVFEIAGIRPGAISAIGREFAIFMENGSVTGTAGQLLPGLAPADRLMPGEVFHFIGLRDRQLPQGPERSHLGVLNLGTAEVVMSVESYDANGTFEGMVQRTIRAGEQLRVNRVLRAANSAVDDGLKRIEVTADGPLFVLAYRVNATGDPVTLRPFRR